MPVTRREGLILTALLLTFLAVDWTLAWQTGVTADESSHLLSASRYWTRQDNLGPGDMPPLIKLAGGWVPNVVGFPLPSKDNPVWKTQHEWPISLAALEVMSAEAIQRLFGWSRMPFVVFPIACILLIWWWCRELYGVTAALFAAAAFAMTPTVLGHSALVKNDLACSFSYLFFAYRTWKMWQSPSLRNALWIGVATLLGTLAKLSLLILPPLAVLVLAVCTLRVRNWRLLLASIPAVALLIYVGTLAAWQWEHESIPLGQLDSWVQAATLPGWFYSIGKLAIHIPLPARLWAGIWNIASSNAGDAAIYYLGKLHSSPQPLYFVTSFLLKTPLSLLAWISLGLVIAIVRRQSAVLFWLIPAVLYVSLASTSKLQLGLRLVLPAVACITIATAVLVQACVQARHSLIRMLPAFLALGTLAETAWAFPHYISYFNPMAGGPANAIHLLSGSNLDWGQSLPPLQDYLNAHPGVGPVRLYYFGAGWPGKWIPDERHELMPPPWGPDLVKTNKLIPEPGYYAISGTMLTGQLFSPEYRDYFEKFRSMTPIAVPGGCIFVYRVAGDQPGRSLIIPSSAK